MVSAGTHIKCAAGYLWSASVRSTDLDFSPQKNPNSYPALQATERGLSRGNLSPLTRFCLLLAVQKEAPAGQAYSLCLCKRLRDADRRDEAIAIVCAGNPSGSFHSPPPFTQGRLLVGAMPKARRNYVVVCAGNPSASLTAASLSLRLGHGAALICHWHIIHYRAATSLPLAQGSLLVDAMPEFGMKGVAGDGDAEPSAASGGCSEAEHP